MSAAQVGLQYLKATVIGVSSMTLTWWIIDIDSDMEATGKEMWEADSVGILGQNRYQKSSKFQRQGPRHLKQEESKTQEVKDGEFKIPPIDSSTWLHSLLPWRH